MVKVKKAAPICRVRDHVLFRATVLGLLYNLFRNNVLWILCSLTECCGQQSVAASCARAHTVELVPTGSQDQRTLSDGTFAKKGELESLCERRGDYHQLVV